ncbi:unnamed protein product [Cuscuta epithymum]|uniref:glycerophosphodiester phosphodiesterase n=1 Tax=Cuscuta epithymum TaxID=186058 RepID=A0AAV0G9K8_9ASTE|nr:unnamed protein product [Cuscuta epithymum]
MAADIPNPNAPENASLCRRRRRYPQGAAKFVVIGHRGNGMNVVQSPDRRLNAFKENSIRSFNAAAHFFPDFIEFDVQVTKDDCPVIFHDDFILSQHHQDGVVEKKITELSLAEFLSYGPRKEGEEGKLKPLLRKTKDGKIARWSVERDDALCTLQEALEMVKPPKLGFNIELKFEEHRVYPQEQLRRVLGAVLRVVSQHANDRPILFSTFHPDAALMAKQLQSMYPVFFLTNAAGGHSDPRRESLEEAVKLCLEGGLEGIVCEVKGVFRNPGLVNHIKECNLSLFTYGTLNNVVEAVYMQHIMGIDGVIVDFVGEISQAVADMLKQQLDHHHNNVRAEKPNFSPKELSFLLKLIPQLIQPPH